MVVENRPPVFISVTSTCFKW